MLKKVTLAAALLAAFQAHSAPVVTPVRVAPTPVRIAPTPVRPVTPVRSATPTRTSTSTTSTAANAALMMTVPMIVANSSAAQTDSSGSLVVNPMFFTACSTEQYENALVFQEVCKVTSGINSTYCPILSFFRECDRVESVEGLQPIKPEYRHVFFKSEQKDD
ncbi:hypothetical protein V8046_003708 [Vibrio parahaemolyticus]|uniref:hypothetical protein n=1 Tax=Vibrio harveyi group TaxID=717610 RepID=UPI001123AB66|nr:MULTISPECIES: hypothetical protein [Vibrio harveyi group]EIA1624652.1 hypothetical protein [Vibrio parahaemolyticus]EIV8635973.1 hypothetical protein [Vibrio parahaemolyticus]EIZ1449477.1 hypothetical protein [Vibrio parahaemolyticus]EJF4459585.1 hypothetical protein [Vibrio parahaemolyticus]EKB1972470.1 hypothetical protein [Vibrio parahaemolyticus]